MYYKYRDISDRTESILTNKEIWAAKPATLNDPFECSVPQFTKTQILKHAQKVKASQLAGFINEAHQAHANGEVFFNIHGRAIKQLLNKIKNTKAFDRKYRVVNNFYKNIGHNGFSDPKGQAKSVQTMLNNVGVFSLSEDPLNMLMWSHYGANHEGIVLGFEPEDGTDLANEDFFQPVIYSDEGLKVDLSNGLMNSVSLYADKSGKPTLKSFVEIKDPQIQKVLFTKTTHWSYEKEWRYLRQDYGSYPLPGKLSKIIFGLNCKKDNINKYISIANKKFDGDIKFFVVVRLDGTTELSLNEYK